MFQVSGASAELSETLEQVVESVRSVGQLNCSFFPDEQVVPTSAIVSNSLLASDGINRNDAPCYF
ncbi:MAG TPA: hypothetical protein V6D50_22555 [Chroococcales cyanobacterium]